MTDVKRLLDEATQALEKIAAVHSPDPDGGMGYQEGGGYGSIDPACRECGTADEYAVAWPCGTRQTADAALRRLRGEA